MAADHFLSAPERQGNYDVFQLVVDVVPSGRISPFRCRKCDIDVVGADAEYVFANPEIRCTGGKPLIKYNFEQIRRHFLTVSHT